MPGLDDDYLTNRRTAYEATTQGEWWATEALDNDADAAYGVAAGSTEDYTAMVVTTTGSASFPQGAEIDRVATVEWIALAHNSEPAVLALMEAAEKEHYRAREFDTLCVCGKFDCPIESALAALTEGTP